MPSPRVRFFIAVPNDVPLDPSAPDQFAANARQVRQWMENKYGLTFEDLAPIVIQSNYAKADFDKDLLGTAKRALSDSGITPEHFPVPAYVWAYGAANAAPNGGSDGNNIAVKEAYDPGVIAHELGHIWLNRGNEAHFDTDPTDGPFAPPSIMGPEGTANFAQARFIPAHEAALRTSPFLVPYTAPDIPIAKPQPTEPQPWPVGNPFQ